MSDSVRPLRWQSSRLPHPWDSPGKKTGVCCHFLLQYMEVKSEVAQLCLTFGDPMDHSLPGSSVHEIFQTRVLEWGAIAFSDPRSYSVSILIFWGLYMLFSIVAASTYIPINKTWGFSFLYILTNTHTHTHTHTHIYIYRESLFDK